jgi:hypothetical protein
VTAKKRQEELRDAVVDAAVELIREFENPEPDALYRYHLRARFVDAVHAFRKGMK